LKVDLRPRIETQPTSAFLFSYSFWFSIFPSFLIVCRGAVTFRYHFCPARAWIVLACGPCYQQQLFRISLRRPSQPVSLTPFRHGRWTLLENHWREEGSYAPPFSFVSVARISSDSWRFVSSPRGFALWNAQGPTEPKLVFPFAIHFFAAGGTSRMILLAVNVP